MKRMTLALAASLLTLTVPSCKQEHVSLDQLGEKLDALETEVTSVKRSATALRADLERARKDAATTSDALDAAVKLTRLAQADQAALAREFSEYRNQYRLSIQKRAPGMDIGSVNLAGTTYNGVRVKALDAWELSFMHAGGAGRVALKDLSGELKELFAFDPNAGPKPQPVVASDTLEVDAIPSTTSTPTPPPASAPGTARAAPLPYAARTAATPSGNAGKKGEVITNPDGTTTEIIARWGSANGGSGGGNKVKGATATVPQGYRPIGSNYSGTSMDKVHKTAKDKKTCPPP